MKVLIACEESQTVCKAMRAKGHEAYSCDIQECSGCHPEWHILGDALPLINGSCKFTTMDGAAHEVCGKWDLLIAHPPCTYLSGVTTRHLSLRVTPAEKVVDRMWKLAEAAVFFMHFALADCEKIAVENPSGFMTRLWRKPDQTIQPYFFAKSTTDIENYQKKRTCLWLKGLNPLQRTSTLPPPQPYGYTKTGKAINFEEAHGKIPGLECNPNSAKARSKTFPGIAAAMADQWAGECRKTEKKSAPGDN